MEKLKSGGFRLQQTVVPLLTAECMHVVLKSIMQQNVYGG